MSGEVKVEGVKVEIPVYNDVWMDNGVVNLYKILEDVNGVKAELERNHLKFDILDSTQFLKGLQKTIEEKMNSVIFVKRSNEKTGEVKNVKKDYILSQYGKKIGGKNVLKEKIYSETENRLREIFDSIVGGNKTCVLCGKSYSKNVDKLKQSVYPLVTKIRSLSGIRTIEGLKDYNDALCPLCYLAGSLEWTDENIIFRSFLGGGKRRYSIVILPLMSNLAELHKFKDRYLPMVRDNVHDLISNIRTSTGQYTEGESTILLYFYEKFFNDVWFQEEVPEDLLEYSGVKKEICKEWTVMKVPSGAVKNIKYTKLGISDNVLGTVYELTKRGSLVYSSFISKTLFINERDRKINYEETQALRESISDAILSDDFDNFAYHLLPRKGGFVTFPRGVDTILYELINIWKWYKMGMNEEELTGLKNVARIVAEVAEEGHISILYKLDKARNPDEFLSGMRELSRRIIGLKEEKRRKIYPPSLETLVEVLEKNKENSEMFEDIKNVLIIFSCVELSQIKYPKSKIRGGENG